MKKIIAGLLIAVLAIAGIGIGYKINQADASGFINLFGLSIKVKALLDAERENNNK